MPTPKPKFDPSQPFEVDAEKPAFDPSQPFETATAPAPAASKPIPIPIFGGGGYQPYGKLPDVSPERLKERAGTFSVLAPNLIPGFGQLSLPVRAVALGLSRGGTSLATGSTLPDAAEDAGIASLAEVGGTGAAAAMARAAAPISRFAQNQGAKALGFIQSSLSRSGRDEARRVAQVALDEGVLSPLASAETMGARAEVVREQAGQLLGEIRRQVDDLSPGADILPALRRVNDQLDDWVRGTTDEPLLRRHLQETLQDIAAHADPSTGRISAEMLAKAKKTLAERAYSNALQVPETLGGQLAPRTETARGVLQGAEDDYVGQVLPQRAGEFQRGKDVYGAMEKLTNPRFGAVEARANRDLGNNQVFGLTPLIAGAAGGGEARGLGLAVLSRFLHQRGNQLSATAADRLARASRSPFLPMNSRTAAQIIAELAAQERR